MREGYFAVTLILFCLTSLCTGALFSVNLQPDGPMCLEGNRVCAINQLPRRLSSPGVLIWPIPVRLQQARESISVYLELTFGGAEITVAVPQGLAAFVKVLVSLVCYGEGCAFCSIYTIVTGCKRSLGGLESSVKLSAFRGIIRIQLIQSGRHTHTHSHSSSMNDDISIHQANIYCRSDHV